MDYHLIGTIQFYWYHSIDYRLIGTSQLITSQLVPFNGYHLIGTIQLITV